MKYYSEKLDKVFDTEKELREAEGLQTSDCEPESQDRSSTDSLGATPSPTKNASTKKELADAVAKREEELKEAYELYNLAEKRVSELSKKYLEEADSILGPAKEHVKKAEQAKYDAIKAFNENYGTYCITYSGARAAEEMNRAIESFDRAFQNSTLGRLFNSLYWF